MQKISAHIFKITFILLFTFAVIAAPAHALQSISKELTRLAALKAGILAGIQASDFFIDAQFTDAHQGITKSPSDIALFQNFLTKIIHTLPETNFVFHKNQFQGTKLPHIYYDFVTASYSLDYSHFYLSKILSSEHKWHTNQSHFLSFTRDRP